MRLLTAVWAKEVIDNVRDRRTLLSSLIFGPLFGPILFVFMINVMLDEATADVDELLELPVSGQEHAGELMSCLGGNGVKVVPGPVDAREAVSRGDVSMVLVIPASTGEQIRAGQPAPLQLIVNNAKNRDRSDVRKAKRLLGAYRNQLVASRLQARGINPLVLHPLVIDEIDVSTAVGRALVVLGMMTYFILFSMLSAHFLVIRREHIAEGMRYHIYKVCFKCHLAQTSGNDECPRCGVSFQRQDDG